MKPTKQTKPTKPTKPTTKFKFRTFKDGNREYWYVSCKKVGEEQILLGDEKVFDWVWEYKISREDNKCKFVGQITGQYDELPTASDIMKDFQCKISCLAIDMARHLSLA